MDQLLYNANFNAKMKIDSLSEVCIVYLHLFGRCDLSMSVGDIYLFRKHQKIIEGFFHTLYDFLTRFSKLLLYQIPLIVPSKPSGVETKSRHTEIK